MNAFIIVLLPRPPASEMTVSPPDDPQNPPSLEALHAKARGGILSASTQEVLHSYLGRRPALKLAALILFILGPAIILRQEIAFDPAAFVQEWIKIGVTSVILFLIIEVAKMSSTASRKLSKIVNRAGLPLSLLSAEVAKLQISLSTRDQSVTDTARRVLALSRHLHASLADLRSELDFPIEASILESLSSLAAGIAKAKLSQDLVPEDLEGMLVTINDIHSRLGPAMGGIDALD